MYSLIDLTYSLMKKYFQFKETGRNQLILVDFYGDYQGRRKTSSEDEKFAN